MRDTSPAALEAKAGGGTDVCAASRVALDDMEVSTGRVGLTVGWSSPAIGVFLLQYFAHGAPCLHVPTMAADTLFDLSKQATLSASIFFTFPMDVAAPSPDARTICRLVCALLPAIIFPAFLQFVYLFFGKVMPYSRQRKAAKQVMQYLGDGTTPEGEGQVRKS